MGTTNAKAIHTLLDLIQLDGDAIQLYDQALEHVDDPDVRVDLESFRADHERHVGDLTKIVFDLGGDVPPANLDLKGEILRVLTEMRSASGTKGALKAMRMNERLTNRAYEKVYAKVVDHQLPEAAVYVITRNLADERRHLDTIKAHLERLGHPDEEEVEGNRGTFHGDRGSQGAIAEDVVPPPRR